VNASLPALTTSRTVKVLDAALALWVVAWIVIALLVGHEVGNLRTLSDTVVSAGRALEQTGRALHSLDGLPFVGDRLRPVEARVNRAAAQAVRSGRSSRSSISNLSVLLALSIALIPTVPLIALYAPFRLSWARDVRAVRRGAADARDAEAFEEFLAHRAAENLPYHRVRLVTANPWRDLESGRYGPLADAELRRLGLRAGHRPGGRRA